MKTLSKEEQLALTPVQAVDILVKGNERFLNNLSVNRNLLEAVDYTKDGQYPFAAILSCSDSRVPVELVFDQGLGDVFSVRLAGNIASINAIGSLEFACKYLGAKLIVVLGHTKCGAVKGACDKVSDGSLDHIFKHINPAVDAETDEKDADKRNSKNAGFLNNVTHLNVQQQITAILDNSSILKDMLEKQLIGIVGAIYDVETGAVKFYEEDRVFNPNHQFEKIKTHLILG